MNIVNIKNFQNILNNNIKYNKIIKRERKIYFRHILYGSIYKSVNNTSFDTVTYQINKIFIDKNLDKTITKTSFIKKKNNIYPKYFLEINSDKIDKYVSVET